MKKARKGFTLVELLIVIGIMGILGAMGIIAGQEATSAARATAVADNLEKLATAGMMFYAENAAEIDKTGKLKADDSTVVNATALAAGINAYLKTENAIADTAGNNTYFATVDGSDASATWWVGYQFGTSDGEKQIKKAMVNKVNRMGLKKAAAGDAFTDAEAETAVYMKIR